MSVQLKDGVIVITGASSGIGWAMAMELAVRARALIIVARREERLEALKEKLVGKNPQLIVEVCRCDLSDMDANTPPAWENK